MSDSQIAAAAAAAEGLSLGRPEVGAEGESADLQKRKRIQWILNQLNAANFPELLGELFKEIDSSKALETVLTKLYDAVTVCKQQTPAYAPVRSSVTLIQLYADVCVCIHRENQRTNPSTNEPGKLFFQTDGSSEEEHGGQFLSVLVSRCQEDFERLSIPQDKSSEEKRRLFCNVEFIGQLYKNGLLATATVLTCLKTLLESHYEHSGILFEQPGSLPPRDMDFQQLEAFCNLMKTVGLALDRPEMKDLLDGYFRHLEHVMKQPTIGNRMKFIIRHIIELRSCNWDPQRLPAAHKQETAAPEQLHAHQPFYPTDSELSEEINAIWCEEPNKHVKAVAGCIMFKHPTWSVTSSRVISIVESKNAHRLPSCAPSSAAVPTAAAGGGVPWNPSPRSAHDGVGASNEDCDFVSDVPCTEPPQFLFSDKTQSSEHAYTRNPPPEWLLVSDKDGSSESCKYIPPPGFCSKRIHVFVDLSNVVCKVTEHFSEILDADGNKKPDFRFGIKAPVLADIVERGKDEVDTKVVSRFVIASVPITFERAEQKLAKEKNVSVQEWKDAGGTLWKDWKDAGYHVIPFECVGRGEQNLDHSLRMYMQKCISSFGKGNPVDGERKPVDKMVLVSGDNNADGLPDDPAYRVRFGDILEEAITKGFEVEVWSWEKGASRAYKRDLPSKHGALFKMSFLRESHMDRLVSRPLEPPKDSGAVASSLPAVAVAAPPPAGKAGSSSSKKDKKTETGAAVAPAALDASDGKITAFGGLGTYDDWCKTPTAAAVAGGGVPWNPSPRSTHDGVGACNEDVEVWSSVSNKPQSSDHAFTQPVSTPAGKRGSSRSRSPDAASGPIDVDSNKIAHLFVDSSNVNAGCIHIPAMDEIARSGFSRFDSAYVVGSSDGPTEHSAIWKYLNYKVKWSERHGQPESVFNVDDTIAAVMMRDILRERDASNRAMVVLSGDGNDNDGWASIFEAVQHAVSRGWAVKIISNPNILSGKYFKLQHEFPLQLQIQTISQEQISQAAGSRFFTPSLPRDFSPPPAGKRRSSRSRSTDGASKGVCRWESAKAAPFLPVFGNNTAVCFKWNLSGSCKHGVTCRFLHNAASMNVSTPAGPVAVSESAVAHAPPASEHGSGRDRSPDAASSKNDKKAEAGAAVAHAADASKPVSAASSPFLVALDPDAEKRYCDTAYHLMKNIPALQSSPERPIKLSDLLFQFRAAQPPIETRPYGGKQEVTALGLKMNYEILRDDADRRFVVEQRGALFWIHVSPSRDVMGEVPLELLISRLIVCDCGNPTSLIEPILRAKWNGIVSLELNDLRVLTITFQSERLKLAAQEGMSRALVIVTPVSQQALHGDLLSFDFELLIAASLDRRNMQCALLSMSPVPAIGGVGGGFFLKFVHEEFVPVALRILSEDAEFLKFFRIMPCAHLTR